MQYLGGKHKIARHIVPFMEMFYRRDHTTWVEPFMGACNTLALASGDRIGNDIDPDLVALFKALQKGFDPPSKVTEEEYNRIKENPSAYPPELCAFVGFGCSFGGKKWASFARNKRGREFAEVARRGLQRKMRTLSRVRFVNGGFQDLEMPSRSFIYCDPPYAHTLGYGHPFDHDEFWQWCRDKSLQGHTVLISEYSAPDDFEPITSSKQRTSFNNSQNWATEKIFKWSGDE